MPPNPIIQAQLSPVPVQAVSGAKIAVWLQKVSQVSKAARQVRGCCWRCVVSRARLQERKAFILGVVHHTDVGSGISLHLPARSFGMGAQTTKACRTYKCLSHCMSDCLGLSTQRFLREKLPCLWLCRKKTRKGCSRSMRSSSAGPCRSDNSSRGRCVKVFKTHGEDRPVRGNKPGRWHHGVLVNACGCTVDVLLVQK